MSGNRIEVIQVVRGLSALIVVLFHCKSILSEKDSLKGTLDWLFNPGAAGVDIFFVISGFIMVYSTSFRLINNTGNTLSFLSKRIVRIWPPYFIITLIYVVLQHKLNAFKDAEFNIYFFKSIFFIPIELKDAPLYGYPVIPVGWSLNYEIYFYFIFSLSLLFGKLRYVFILAYFAATLCIIPYIFNYSFTVGTHQIRESIPLYLNFITNPILWEFVAGMILGIIYLNHTISTFIEKFSPRWLPYLIILFVVWSYISGYLWGHGITEWGLLAFLLLFAAVFYFQNFKYNRYFILLGEISYSLYLVHLPVQYLLFKYFTRFGYAYYLEGQSALLLIVGASIITSYISYHLIEKNLSYFLLKRFKRRNRKSYPTYTTLPSLEKSNVNN